MDLDATPLPVANRINSDRPDDNTEGHNETAIMQFIDLAAQQARIRPELDAAIAAVMEHCQFVLGPEVGLFEAELAKFSEAKYAISVANGTDALQLALMAWGIGPGDAVFCPSFTYHATAEAIAVIGATPVFVDIDRTTYNMDPTSLANAIEGVKSDGSLTSRAVMVVDLFGQLADYPALSKISKAHGLKLISDCAQAFGSTRGGHHAIHWADMVTTSFFPAKPLGCYGDGGAILTQSEQDRDTLISLRMHGKGTERYDNTQIGVNSRLDTIQAAILRTKLNIFQDEIEKRQEIAKRYSDALSSNIIQIPTIDPDVVSTFAQYTIEVPDPDALAASLSSESIPTARYYPRPTHRQTAYQTFPIGEGGLPNTDAASERTISLPFHAYLSTGDQDRVIAAIQRHYSA